MMKNAAHAGISISDFWNMAPVEINIYVSAFLERKQADYDESLSVAYFGACMHRVKKMPPLDKFIKGKPKKKAKTSGEMLEEIKRLNAAFGGDTY